MVSGTTVSATASGQDDCSTSNPDVWYSFTPAMTGDYGINVVETMDFGSSSTYVYVFTGICGGALTDVTSSCFSTGSTINVTMGTTYLVNVRSTSSTTGVNFDLCVYKLPPPPANDTCSGAFILMESGTSCDNAASGTTVSATASTVADSSCSTSNSDVWYTFSPALTADYIFSVTETMDFGSSSTYVSVYSGACGALTQINSSCFSTTTTVALTASTTYYVNVRSTSSTTGVNFDLCAYTCVPIVPDYLESFDVFNGICWNEADAGDPTTGPMTLGTGSWTGDDFGNVSGGPNGKSAKINAFLTHTDWLLSPLFDLSAGGYTLTFDVAATEYNTTLTAVWPVTDTMFFLVSEGGGSWNTIQTWTSSTIPSAAGDSITVDLTPYTNSSTQFAFYYTTGGLNSPEDIDVFVDEFEIKGSSPCGPVTVPGNPASGTYQGTTISSDATILSPNMVIFKAQTSIDLNALFEVKLGAQFDALIEDCP